MKFHKLSSKKYLIDIDGVQVLLHRGVVGWNKDHHYSRSPNWVAIRCADQRCLSDGNTTRKQAVEGARLALMSLRDGI